MTKMTFYTAKITDGVYTDTKSMEGNKVAIILPSVSWPPPFRRYRILKSVDVPLYCMDLGMTDIMGTYMDMGMNDIMGTTCFI